MNTITHSSELIELLELGYKANLPVLIEGTHGIGKSEIIEQAATAMRIRCIVRDLSLMEPPDLIGMPRSDKGRTVYDPPEFLPKNGKGLLVFEELNRCERYMMAPCLQLLTARTLNDYRLPGGWLPVAAINPSGDEYEVNDLDPALLSRFIRVRYAPTPENWLAWAGKNGIHSDVFRYVRDCPGVFDTGNPRSWTGVSNLLNATAANTKPSTLNNAIAGLVGAEHAAAFFHIGGCPDVEISADDVIERYATVEATIQQWFDDGQTDRLAALSHKLLLALQHGDTCPRISADVNMTGNLIAVLKVLPADLAAKIRKAAREGGIRCSQRTRKRRK